MPPAVPPAVPPASDGKDGEEALAEAETRKKKAYDQAKLACTENIGDAFTEWAELEDNPEKYLEHTFPGVVRAASGSSGRIVRALSGQYPGAIVRAASEHCPGSIRVQLFCAFSGRCPGDPGK